MSWKKEDGHGTGLSKKGLTGICCIVAFPAEDSVTGDNGNCLNRWDAMTSQLKTVCYVCDEHLFPSSAWVQTVWTVEGTTQPERQVVYIFSVVIVGPLPQPRVQSINAAENLFAKFHSSTPNTEFLKFIIFVILCMCILSLNDHWNLYRTSTKP